MSKLEFVLQAQNGWLGEVEEIDGGVIVRNAVEWATTLIPVMDPSTGKPSVTPNVSMGGVGRMFSSMPPVRVFGSYARIRVEDFNETDQKTISDHYAKITGRSPRPAVVETGGRIVIPGRA